MIADMNIVSVPLQLLMQSVTSGKPAVQQTERLRDTETISALQEYDMELWTGNTGRKLSMFKADHSTPHSLAQFVVFRFHFCTVGGGGVWYRKMT